MLYRKGIENKFPKEENQHKISFQRGNIYLKYAHIYLKYVHSTLKT